MPAPTTDPFRLRVLKAVTASLEAISTADDYAHNMANSVFRGRVKYGPKDPIPMISILEAPIPLEAQRSGKDNGMSTGSWELLIQGFVDDDRKHPSDPAHLLMADVKRRLVIEKRRERGNDILGMKGRVVELFVGQGSVRPADEASDKGFFWLTLTLQIVEDLNDPYK